MNIANKRIIFEHRYAKWFPLAIFIFVVLFAIVAPFDRLFPFSIKRVLVFFFFLIVAIYFLINRKHNQIYYFLFGVLLFYLIRTSMSPETIGHFKENFEDFTYYSAFLFCVVLASDSFLTSSLKKIFLKQRYLILVTVAFINCVFLLSYFFPNSFDGGTKNGFRGLTLSSHSAASLSIFTIILLLSASFKMPLFYIPSVVFVFLTKARTFYLLLTVLYLFYLFVAFKNAKKALIVFSISFLAAISLLFIKPIRDKIFYSAGGWYENHPIEAITSGRSNIWSQCLDKFFSKGFSTKMLGESFSYVKNVNEQYVSINGFARNSAHNDLIEILLSMGLIGLFFSFFFVFSMVSKQNAKSKKILLILFILFASFFNGLFFYFNLSLSLVLISSIETNNKNDIICDNAFQVKEKNSVLLNSIVCSLSLIVFLVIHSIVLFETFNSADNWIILFAFNTMLSLCVCCILIKKYKCSAPVIVFQIFFSTLIISFLSWILYVEKLSNFNPFTSFKLIVSILFDCVFIAFLLYFKQLLNKNSPHIKN